MLNNYINSCNNSLVHSHEYTPLFHSKNHFSMYKTQFVESPIDSFTQCDKSGKDDDDCCYNDDEEKLPLHVKE